jgi:RNA polymerase sigma factor (sigma-70 family)
VKPSDLDRPTAFSTTRWSVVLRADRELGEQGAEEGVYGSALAELCRVYWYPLYSYVRRQGYSKEDAEDLTQAFFARLLSRTGLGGGDPEIGRFRSFLLTSMKRFLIDEWRKMKSQRREGETSAIRIDASGAEDRYAKETGLGYDAERIYDRGWALTVIERVQDRLAEDYRLAGRSELHGLLSACLDGGQEETYAELAPRAGMSVGGFTMAVHRYRRRFAEEIRKEIAETVDDPAEVDDELRWLMTVLGG